jgi:anti-sigma regulatory factor (Ser/Thr protein kinase)
MNDFRSSEAGLGALRWSFESTDARAVGTVRQACAKELRRAGLSGEDLTSAELVLGELLGNVYRHAPGRAEVRLDLAGTAPVVHILDTGPGFEIDPHLPADVMSERGRGLYIIAALVAAFSAKRRRAGTGSHVRVMLNGEIRPRD